MVDSATWVPEGFVEGTHPRITAELAATLTRRGPAAGPVSVALRIQEGKDADALAFLRERPERRGKKLQPNLYAAMLSEAEIDAVIAREELFAWVGQPHRLTGERIEQAAANAAVKLSVAKGKSGDVKAAIEAIGGRVVGAGATEVLALLRADKLADLLRIPGIDGADVSAA